MRGPSVVRLAVVDLLRRHGVDLLLGCAVCGVTTENAAVTTLSVSDGTCRMPIEARFVVDCTGDAAIVSSAGAECEKGGPGGEFQPVSLVFQMGPVDFHALLQFVRDHPDEVLLAENPVIGKSPAECANALCEAGYPYLALSAAGRLLGSAIEAGEMYPCTAIFMSPTSMARREVTLNSTRVANVDATDSRELSRVLPVLVEQVETCVRFARSRLPVQPGGSDAPGASRGDTRDETCRRRARADGRGGRLRGRSPLGSSRRAAITWT